MTYEDGVALAVSGAGEPERRRRAPHQGVGLALSGGGYRAMLFHVGSLWRLAEAGVLERVARISSVSGGAIAAAFLAQAWPSLRASGWRDRNAFEHEFVGPVRRLAGQTVDWPSVILGAVMPGSTAGAEVARRYARAGLGRRTLQDLPKSPRFVFNATNLQSGALWRFSRPYMRDWRVGEVRRPRVPLATVVAASSAFPPFLSPAILRLDPTSFTPGSGNGLQRAPYDRRVVLSDGGVYDNLGLETVFKRYRTVLVSDAGGRYEPEQRPLALWPLQGLRVAGTIDNQVRSLRKRALLAAYRSGERTGAYWSIRTRIEAYGLPDALPCPTHRTQELARLRTRLHAQPSARQERLINWGYAVADAALRRHHDPTIPPPACFPYPTQGV